MANIVKKLLGACLSPDGSPPTTRQNTIGSDDGTNHASEPEKQQLARSGERQPSTSTALPAYEAHETRDDEQVQQQQQLFDEPEEFDAAQPVMSESPSSNTPPVPLSQSPVNDSETCAQGLTASPTGSIDDLAGADLQKQPAASSNELFKRPGMPRRLPSESLSITSSSSASSDEGELEGVSARALGSRLDKTNPRPSNTSSRPSVPRPSDPERYLSADISPSVLSSSPLAPITEPSTPIGFAKHRHSASQASAKGVRETLDAYITDSRDDEVNEHGVPAQNHRSRRINQYRIGKLLGKGSAASVYLAQDDNGSYFACKEFSKSTLRRRKKSEMLRAKRGRRGPLADFDQEEKDDPLTLIRTEIAIMKKLHHPNLVQLHEVLDVPHDDCLFLMMELCRGGPLTWVSPNPDAPESSRHIFSEGEALNWFRQLLLAVEYLHENGVIHRDIKPENILFADEDHVVCKIVDFGVSEMFRSPNDDRSTKAVGSPAFMSPELLSEHGGSGFHGRPADIWALGVTLYCLCTGHLPFQSPNYLELNEMILKEPVRIREDLSPPLQHLLSRILDKNPETRVTLDELRQHEWVTQYGAAPLPSKEDNVAALVEEPDSHEVRAAITPGHIMRIAAAVKAAKKLKAVAERNRAKRTMSGNTASERSVPSPCVTTDTTTTSQDSSVLSTTELSMNELGDELSRQVSQPQPTRPAVLAIQEEQEGHGRIAPGGSVDDTFLDKVRYVEDELGRPVVERGSDLERPSRTPSAQGHTVQPSDAS